MKKMLLLFAIMLFSLQVSADPIANSPVNASRILRSYIMGQDYNTLQKQYTMAETNGNVTTTITMSADTNTFGFDYAEMADENEIYHVLISYNPFSNDEIKTAKFTYSFIDADHEERQFIMNGEVMTDFPESELNITNYMGNRRDMGSLSYYTTKNQQAIENLSYGVNDKLYEALQSIDEMLLSKPELTEKNIDIRTIGFKNIEKKSEKNTEEKPEPTK